MVINHESASSSDSSTVGSIGSDNKTYLRGQNIPVDAQILQEREVRRQKALELQSAIKKQLEEKDRQRKEEKERRLREERLEEERIKREREKEKERYKYIEFIFTTDYTCLYQVNTRVISSISLYEIIFILDLRKNKEN